MGFATDNIVFGLKSAWSLFLIEFGCYLIVVALLSAPGYVILFRKLRNSSLSLLERFLCSFLGGLFIGTLGSVVFIKLFGLLPSIILTTFSVTTLIFWCLFKRPESKLLKPHKKISLPDLVWFLICLLSMAVGTMMPFSRICEKTDAGYAVRAYYSADYLKHVSVTAELSKGDIPPENPFFSGEKLHYYWLSYLPSAITYRLLGPDFSLLRITIAFSLVVNVLLLLSLFSVFSRYVKDISGRIIGIAALLFASSYEGLMALYKIISQGGHISLIRNYNIDAFTRWEFGHPQVDSLFRSFIYTPQQQYALCALCMIFILLRKDVRFSASQIKSRLTIFVLIGIFSGAVLGYNFFTGAIVLPWLCLCLGIGWLFTKNYTYVDILVISSILGCLIISYYFLEMFLNRSNVFTFATGINYYKKLPKIILYNFGPLFLLGIPGIATRMYRSDKQHEWLNVFLLTLMAASAMLFVKIEEFPSDVSLKTGLLVALGLSLFVGDLIQTLKKKTGVYGTLLASILLVPALPHAIIDVYNTQDIMNAHFTVYFNEKDMSAAHWIAKNTPLDCRIQALPERDIHCSDIINAFAERRTALADSMHAQIYLINPTGYKTRNKKISALINNPNLQEALKLCREYEIDYIFIGNQERELNSSGIDKFFLFNSIYTDYPVEIFDVAEFKPATFSCSMKNNERTLLSDIIYRDLHEITVDLGQQESQAWYWGDFSSPEIARGPNNYYTFQWLQQGACSFLCPPDFSDSWQVFLRIRPLSAPNLKNQVLSFYITDMIDPGTFTGSRNQLISRLPLENSWQEYQITIPTHPIYLQQQQIVMVPLKSSIPAQLIPGSKDQRHLSVAFDWVRFTTKSDSISGSTKNSIFYPAPYPNDGMAFSAPFLLGLNLSSSDKKWLIKGQVSISSNDFVETHISVFVRFTFRNRIMNQLLKTIIINDKNKIPFAIEFIQPEMTTKTEMFFITSKMPVNSVIILENVTIITQKDNPSKNAIIKNNITL